MQKYIRSVTALKGALLLGVAAVPLSGAQAATIIGNDTQVSVSAFDALVGLGLTLSPFGTATVDTSGALPVATFAITGGTVDDMSGDAIVLHEGSGLTFTAGATSVTYSDFVIDTGNALLTSTVTMGGGASGSIDLFTIDDSFNLFLTDAAAGGLTTVFGAPDLSGTEFGTATVDIAVAGAIPEPGTWMMMILGFGAMGGALRYRKRKMTTAAA